MEFMTTLPPSMILLVEQRNSLSSFLNVSEPGTVGTRDFVVN